MLNALLMSKLVIDKLGWYEGVGWESYLRLPSSTLYIGVNVSDKYGLEHYDQGQLRALKN